MSLFPRLGGRGSNYRLVVGGVEYGVDELPPDLDISADSGASGISVGNCMPCTISGTLIYHDNNLVRNSPIYLYVGETETPTYMWFLSDVTISGNSFRFTGRDVVSFVDNNYDSLGTITQQVADAATVISRLCGFNVEIELPNLYSIGSQILEASINWNIRQLLSYVASADNSNYYMSMARFPTLYIEKIPNSALSISNPDDFAVIEKGINTQTITRVRIFQNNRDVPKLEPGEQLYMYGIFDITGSQTPTDSGTLSFENPLVNVDNVGLLTHSSRIGNSFGTDFNCERVKLDGFIPPLTQLRFGEDPNTYYANSLKYYLTSQGIYAQISGGGKTLSDYEYVGKTEQDILRKVTTEMPYNTVKITNDGLIAVPNEVSSS